MFPRIFFAFLSQGTQKIIIKVLNNQLHSSTFVRFLLNITSKLGGFSDEL